MKIACAMNARAKGRKRSRTLLVASFATTLIATLTAGLLTFFPFSAQTYAAPISPSSGVILPMAAGNPGVPSDPESVFTEDFQNRARGSNILLRDYVGATGERYSSSNYWSSRTNCNGFIVDGYSSRQIGDCNALGNYYAPGAFTKLQLLINAIGQLNGMSDPRANAAVASFTEGNGRNNEVEFETRTPLSLAQSGRFITFSVDAAATSCAVSIATPPKLRFYIVNSAGTEIPVSTNAINPCTDSRAKTYGSGDNTVKAGVFAADGSFLIKGETFGIRMKNETGTGIGNDGAFDNIKVLDATPNSISPSRMPAYPQVEPPR